MKQKTKPMTRKMVFRKAKQQYQSGFVRHTGTGKQKQYYEVEDIDSQKTHMVTIELTDKGLIFEDDCISRSLSGNKSKGTYSPHLCSHIISTIMKIYFDTKLPK